MRNAKRVFIMTDCEQQGAQREGRNEVKNEGRKAGTRERWGSDGCRVSGASHASVPVTPSALWLPLIVPTKCDSSKSASCTRMS